MRQKNAAIETIDGGSFDRGVVIGRCGPGHEWPGLALFFGAGGRGAGGLLEAVGAAELLAEAFDASGGIDELLLAGEERVTLGADVHVDLGERAAGDEGISAGAVNGAGLVAGVGLGFHV